jgi:ribonucleoside-diphosphate reductase alpha chain
VKSLYYCRSLSIQRAENVAGEALGDHALSMPGLDAPSAPIGTPPAPAQPNDYEECLSCQ